MFNAIILKDSVNSNGSRITTAILTFPRCILAEFNTHRVFSRNASSSRAIPAARMIENIVDDPFIPEFRKNKKGMQGTEPLSGQEEAEAVTRWLTARTYAVDEVQRLTRTDGLNIHKQYVNRLLEPWMWCTVLVTATEWNNFFAQRTHHAAEPSFQRIASMMKERYDASIPQKINSVQWHTPFWEEEDDETTCQLTDITYIKVLDYLRDYDERNPGDFRLSNNYSRWRFDNFLIQDICAGRCAKVSYLNLESKRKDVYNDIRLAVHLSTSVPGHHTPFEHICIPALPKDMVYRLDQVTYGHDSHGQRVFVPFGLDGFCANYRGWKSYRRFFEEREVN